MKPSFHHPPILVCGLALLLAACGMLLSTSGALAAHQGAVLVKDTRPGRAGGIRGPLPVSGDFSPQLANDSGTLYFSADDGRHGHELWRSDGTRKGTRMVKDINPGPAGSLFGITPSSSGTPFYFFPDDGVHGAELWRSDGTAAGTSLVKDLYPGPTGSLFNGVGGELINLNGTLYFSYSGFPNPQNQGLYRSDGTDAGTTLVRKIVGVRALTNFNGALYFGGAGDDPTFKIGLWRSDGTMAGTTNIKEGPVPSEIINVNGTMYIGDGYRGLWRSDGTEAGTAVVKNIAPAGAIHDLTAVDGAVYFLASSGRSNSPADELWRSDGTEAGTTIVKYLNVDPGYGFDLAAFKGKLYFTTGGLLWRSDGTPQGTTVIKGNCTPKAGRGTRCFGGLMSTGPNGSLYLSGGDRKHGTELWRSDGTRKGTRIVSNIRPGSAPSLPMYLTAVNRTLFFTAKDGRHGRELWRAGPKPCKTANGKCKKG